MNLTINEQLMNDTKDANLCIFIANLSTWIKFNASKKDPSERNFHEGRYWSYNTIQDFVKYFGFWSTKNIRTIIANCIKLDLIVTNTFNKKKYDNTIWYSLTDKGLQYYPGLRDLILNRLADSGKTLADSGNAIPEELNSLSSINTNTTNSESVDSSVVATTSIRKKDIQVLMRQMIEVYRQEFPDNPQPHPTLISTSLDKVLRTLIKRWPEADPNKNSLTPEAFRLYMRGLKQLSPKFALSEYVTKDGNKKKNNMETFCRWNTFVKFLEDQYS